MVGSPKAVLAGSPKAVLAGSPKAGLAGSPKAVLAGSPKAVLAGSPRAVLAGLDLLAPNSSQCVFSPRTVSTRYQRGSGSIHTTRINTC